jgi:hypothetical protein
MKFYLFATCARLIVRKSARIDRDPGHILSLTVSPGCADCPIEPHQETDMTLNTLAAAALAAITLVALALPAHALNPQPLPPKDSKSWLIARHPANVLKRHAIEAKKPSIRETVR